MSLGPLLPLSLLILLSCLGATGAAEYRLGAGGALWETALSMDEPSFYLLTDGVDQITDRVPVQATPFGAGGNSMIDFSANSLVSRRIDADINMALADPNTNPQKILLPYTGGEAQTTDGCTHVGKENQIVRKMHDGDPATAMFRRFTQDPNAPPGVGPGWGGLGAAHSGQKAAVIDLGAAVPVNHIRFYPRLDRQADRLLIEEFDAPKPDPESFGEDSFVGNLLAWYDIHVGDDTAQFSDGSCDASAQIRGLSWVRTADPQLQLLKSTRENLDVVVDLRFPTRSIRWLTLQPFPLRDWEVAEFEVYGEGYVEHTRYTTQILDFGHPVNWGKLRWSGDLPEGTRIEIRTRTGSTPDPNIYLTANTNGELRPINYAEYLKIDVSGRVPPVYNSDEWSYWSPPYDFQAGLRDERVPASEWLDGTPMISPGLSRYVQIDIRLFATFTASPRLDQLSLQLAEAPSAQQIVGELWPIEIDSFDPVTFTYVVVPSFESGDIGFDRLEILTSTRVDSVHSVVINEDRVDLSVSPPIIEEDRLILSFPRLVGTEDSFKRIEVVFDTAVLRFGTEFHGWVYNSDEANPVRQRVRPGNATSRFSGDVLSVRTPVGGDLLRQVEARPALFTPNGDGHNDGVTFSFQLREVTTPSPVTLKIYDLSGRLVHEFPALNVQSGQYEQLWDGTDLYGRLLPPGTYLFEFILHAQQQERRAGTFGLAY
jgi:gliding motility-associated-like protein